MTNNLEMRCKKRGRIAFSNAAFFLCKPVLRWGVLGFGETVVKSPDFPQGLKPTFICTICGTTEVVPFQRVDWLGDFLADFDVGCVGARAEPCERQQGDWAVGGVGLPALLTDAARG